MPTVIYVGKEKANNRSKITPSKDKLTSNSRSRSETSKDKLTSNSRSHGETSKPNKGSATRVAGKTKKQDEGPVEEKKGSLKINDRAKENEESKEKTFGSANKENHPSRLINVSQVKERANEETVTSSSNGVNEPDFDGIYISQPRFLLQYLVMDSGNAEFISNNLLVEERASQIEVKNCYFGFGKKEKDVQEVELQERDEEPEQYDIEDEEDEDEEPSIKDKFRSLVEKQEKAKLAIKNMTQDLSETVSENILAVKDSYDRLCEQIKSKIEERPEDSQVAETFKKLCEAGADSISAASRNVIELCDKLEEKRQNFKNKISEALSVEKEGSFSIQTNTERDNENDANPNFLRSSVKGLNRYIICKDKSSKYDVPCKDMTGLEDVEYNIPTSSSYVSSVGISTGENTSNNMFSALKDKFFSLFYDSNVSMTSSTSDVSSRAKENSSDEE